MRRLFLLFQFFILTTLFLHSQDSSSTRDVIGFLCSQKCFGRGYVKNGLNNAEKFILKEIKKNKVAPLFGKKYTQSFFHSVNTFPGVCEVSINQKKIKPGIDFILNPNSEGLKGHYDLNKIDSTHYLSVKNNIPISVLLKKKLTYSVGHEQKSLCEIELDQSKFSEAIKTVDIDIENKFVQKFESKNIGTYILGSSHSDSCIVFSAHYDHLGGMGKNTFFPGANDNASGVSLLLNLIKFYSEHPPRYKTVFLFFAGEEAGLLGSKYFVQSNCINLKSIKFLINLDLLGTGEEGIMVVNGSIQEKEFNLLNLINDQLHLVKQIKKRGKAANSDHYWFSEAGVPCFFIYTLGGITAYHDVFDIEKTLPLTAYFDVLKLITQFVVQL